MSTWMKVERLVQQRRHPDHEAQRNGDSACQQEAQPDPAQRMRQLDRDALVVGPVVIEGIRQLPGEGAAHLPQRGKAGGLGAARLLAHHLVVFRLLGRHRRRRPGGARRRQGSQVPDAQDHGEDQQRDQCRLGAKQRSSFHAAPILLMAKLFTYSSGWAGSNSLPITLNFRYAPSGGLKPASAICFLASVSRKTFSAICL